MIASAVKFVVFAVQQKSLVLVEPDRADAKRGFLAVNNLAAHLNRCDELVKHWIFGRPENRRTNSNFAAVFRFRVGTNFRCLARSTFLNVFSVRRNNTPVDFGHAGVLLLVCQSRPHLNCGGAFRQIVAELRVNKNPVRGDGDRRGLVQPGVTVDARALVKPALELARVHANGNEVPAAELHHVRDVLAEGIIAALMPPHQPAVDPDRRVAHHAVEREPDAFAFVLLGQLKCAAIPANAVGHKARAERLETVAHVGASIERQFNRPVVRQSDGSPRRVAERFVRGGAAARASLVQMQRAGPVVAEMEFPVRVEGKVFPRRIGGPKLHRQQRGTRADGKSSNWSGEFHIH